jgi:hypothetical protein
MISQTKLQEHLDDYRKVMGSSVSDFVCPITLEPCTDLIDGHILNVALRNASRRTVIQCKDIDNYYGRTVEPELVRHLNFNQLSDADIVRANRNMQVRFTDGSLAQAFAATGKKAEQAARKFESIRVPLGDEEVQVFIRADRDDPRLRGSIELQGTVHAFPAHWTAAMLKAALLTMFEMIGYAAVLNPMGDVLRNTLSRYYKGHGTRQAAGKYFAEFENAVHVLIEAVPGRARAERFRACPFDSIDNRTVFLHQSGAQIKVLFAMTCIFRINHFTVAVTVPQSWPNVQIDTPWHLYQALLRRDPHAIHPVSVARYDGGVWKVESEPKRIGFTEGIQFLVDEG